MSAARGTTSKNAQGSAEDVRRRKVWLRDTYRANVDALILRVTDEDRLTTTFLVVAGPPAGAPPTLFVDVPDEIGWDAQLVATVPACRCYRCGDLLVYEPDLGVRTLTVDRIVPGCVKTRAFPRGGTYVRHNIRPACLACNTSTGAALATRKKA